MKSSRLDFGTLTFQLETEGQINARSRQAKRIGNVLVKDVNERLFDVVADGLVPGYHVFAILDDIRQGSLLYYLTLHADIILGASSASIALGKFVKDYPSLKAGVLAIAIDINAVSCRLFKVIQRHYPLKLFAQNLHSEAQIKVEAQIIEAKLVAAEIEEQETRERSRRQAVRGSSSSAA